jgi:hypothetical protein
MLHLVVRVCRHVTGDAITRGNTDAAIETHEHHHTENQTDELRDNERLAELRRSLT